MKRFNLIAFFLLAGFLIFIDRQNGLNFVRRPFQAILVPVQYSFYSLSQDLKSKLDIVFSINVLHETNRRLQEQNAILLAENTKLKGLAEENKSLKEQLNVKIERVEDLIPTTVIGFGPVGQGRYLLIDKGEEAGVKRDAIVILRDILIGKVVDVSPKSARIELLTDPDSKVPVVTESKAKGLLIGHFQSEMYLTEVLPEEQLKEKDVVLTSGESNYPKNLAVGLVEKVKKNDKDIFQEAVVSPLVNYSKLNLIFVVK